MLISKKDRVNVSQTCTQLYIIIPTYLARNAYYIISLKCIFKSAAPYYDLIIQQIQVVLL